MAQGLACVDQQVAPVRFGLVVWQFGMPGEFARTLLIGQVGLPERLPVGAHLAHHPLGHLGGQGPEFGCLFQAVGELGIAGDGALSEEVLA
jgi:hypothetical protein